MRITYVGHGTALIELDGVRVLTDPLLRRRVAHLRRVGSSVEPASWQDVDAVCISHLHMDHLDLPSLRLLRPRLLLVPRGGAQLVRRVGAERVVEVDVGDRTTIGGLTVEATPASHEGSRPPFGPRATALGFLVEGSRRVYFAGDTDLFDGMAQLAPLDAALLPVAGFAPTLGPGHLDPGRAAEALRMLRPRMAVPIHWGTFCPLGPIWDRLSYLREPPLAFARFAAKVAPEVDVRVLSPGQSVSLEM